VPAPPAAAGAGGFAGPEPEYSYESRPPDPYNNLRPLHIESREDRGSSYPSWRDATVQPKRRRI